MKSADSSKDAYSPPVLIKLNREKIVGLLLGCVSNGDLEAQALLDAIGADPNDQQSE